ncbi:DUF726-domain-containing protein [Ascodesmis nigricans]|uniref:DUF726-domain-containing protein n=1 Tax=Ascodesmis nigricans TaxID=341454 RepID=A0A4S2N6N3_9PEZI|nr:DUF726-domain-containing protein [Ascodesmis nigricans]
MPDNAADTNDLHRLLTPTHRRALLRLLEKISEAITYDLLKPYDSITIQPRELSIALKSYNAWAERVLQRLNEVLSDQSSGTPRPQRPPYARPKGVSSGSSSSAAKETLEEAPPDPELQKLRFHYPPIATPLERGLKPAQAEAITQGVLLILLSLETYDARSRVMLLYLAASLGVPPRVLAAQEEQTAQTLLAAAEELVRNPQPTTATPKPAAQKSKWAWGAATVGGALLIGLTGGLAAPLLAAGLSGVFGAVGLGGLVTATYLGALASSPVVIGGLFGYYGAKTTGRMYTKYVEDVQDFGYVSMDDGDIKQSPSESDDTDDDDTPLPSAPPPKSLRINVCIPGWLPLPNSFHPLPPTSTLLLRYDLPHLHSLGTALTRLLTSTATLFLTRELATRTALATLYAALWPIALLRGARVLDNPYHVCRHRSTLIGRTLAASLLNREIGRRPVSLFGFSVGARVVWHCLLALAKEADGRGYGIIEDVVLLGAPITATKEEWRLVRSVVAGRLVNGFSPRDWVLGFLEREWWRGDGRVVAGLEAVGVLGVEDVDLGERVGGHLAYAESAGRVVEEVLGDYEGEKKKEAEVKVEGEGKRKMEEHTNILLFDHTQPTAPPPSHHQAWEWDADDAPPISIPTSSFSTLSVNHPSPPPPPYEPPSAPITLTTDNDNDYENTFTALLTELDREQEEDRERQKRKQEALEERRRVRAEERRGRMERGGGGRGMGRMEDWGGGWS